MCMCFFSNVCVHDVYKCVWLWTCGWIFVCVYVCIHKLFVSVVINNAECLLLSWQNFILYAKYLYNRPWSVHPPFLWLIFRFTTHAANAAFASFYGLVDLNPIRWIKKFISFRLFEKKNPNLKVKIFWPRWNFQSHS